MKGEHKIKIRDASLDSQPKIQSSSVEETLQIIMGQTNNDCRFRIFIFDKFPTPATFACWKIRFKTDLCTCSQFPTEAMHWIKEVEMVDSGLLQHWTESSTILTSNEESVWSKRSCFWAFCSSRLIVGNGSPTGSVQKETNVVSATISISVEK